MLRMLNRYRTELGVTALPAELEATAQATIRQLQQDTATLSVSRRARDWRRAVVRRRRPQPHRPQVPHRLSVTPRLAARRRYRRAAAASCSSRAARPERRHSPGTTTTPDAARVRTALRGGHSGRPGSDLRADPRRSGTATPTTGLLTATQYLKDNRLLPRGFDKATAPPEIGVYGDGGARRRLRRCRRSCPFPNCSRWGVTVPGVRRTAIPIHRLSLGDEPGRGTTPPSRSDS